MNYGRYRNVRNAAWQCLLDFEINSLPVRLKPITERCGIRVIADRHVHVLGPTDYGKALAIRDKWYIVIDDTRPMSDYRYTIAHELGHIFLGHITTEGCNDFALRYQCFDKKPPTETQADAFATRLLCPAIVLHMMNLTTPEAIMTACQVPLAIAAERAKRMAVLNERNKFLTHPLERKVYENFKKHTEQTNRNCYFC